jgi:cytidylate kinase
LIVAIDGPSASGKSTIGRMLARHLELPLVDTGLMYRAVAVLAHDAGVVPTDEEALTRLARDAEIDVNTTTAEGRHWEVRGGGVDLTRRVFDPSLAPLLTQVSQVRGVREALVERQRRFAGGVVMVGRDIGTVVFPDADVKLFITASDEVRRRRRAAQRREADHGRMKGEISDRDAADQARSISPLRPAEDAYTIDTDDRGPDQVFAEVLRLIPSADG